jgi:uncharacterized membrane protein (DUF2068 family)
MSETQYSPVPPRIRPRQVKIASILMAVFGTLGLIVSALLWVVLAEDASHGRESPVWLYALLAAQVLVSASQVVSGVLIWQGVAWARNLAAVICGLNIAGGVLTLVTGAALQAVVGIVVNIALIRLLYHQDVTDWLSA